MSGERDTTSRRAAMAKARESRRPSRLGTPAGTAEPDYPVEPDAGFPGLLKRTWRQAVAAPDLASALRTLLTLDGHVPADIQLRALSTEHEVALTVLSGLSWRDAAHTEPAGGKPALSGEIGLTTSGRVVVRVPSGGPLAAEEKLVDGALRVPWSAADLLAYSAEVSRAATRLAQSVQDCRQWLATADRDKLLDTLGQAALRTAPFVLYQEEKQYTNFRERNTLTGKTLWPGHPDDALSRLHNLPLDLWSDNDVVMVVCLTLLVRSAGFARIEEANGTQLTVDHVAALLERIRHTYNAVPGGELVPPAAGNRVGELNELAESLRARRDEIKPRVQLYREIHGALMHKIERVAGPYGEAARLREARLCARLRERLPVTGASLAELEANIAAAPAWLATPYGEFGSGFEALVAETVAAACSAFEADFAMSRGIRSLPRLIDAMRARDWATITSWEIADYFCCVVPRQQAARYFDDSLTHLADTAWAMASRMRYNSWHFIAGNLPDSPEVAARDYFVPPTIPDVAFYSDQHHHGHVAAKVRFSIRSPQAVTVLDRTFVGFTDLRLLRCEGTPFDEQDLLAAQRTSAFIAAATGAVAKLVAGGADIEVTAFDSAWHWESITGTPVADDRAPAPALRVS